MDGYQIFLMIFILTLLLFWSLVLLKTLGIITFSAFKWADLTRYFDFGKKTKPIEYPDISDFDFECLEELCGNLDCYRDKICLPILVECVQKNLERCPEKS